MEQAATEDLNIAWAEKAWIQTVADIEKVTGWRLDKEKTPTVEAVIKRINPDSSVSDSNTRKAKRVFEQTLKVIQRTGNIVVPAATAVFGPSQQCFNAVNFVITAVQDYQSVYEQITALMERISVFLERFEIRMKQNAEVLSSPGGSRSDLPLMQPTYRVLEHFVTILGRVQKLTHGWKNKFKLFVKVGAFGEDGGIREALGRLETLVQDVTQTEIAVIGRDLSGMAKDMREFKRWSDQVLEHAARTDATLGQLKTAKEKEDERREMEKVRRKLGLDEKEPWKRHFEKLSEERVEGTGRWLIELPAFRRWAEYSEPRAGVLALQGDANFGKSFLCRTIIEHLFDLYPPKREFPRASVAYYFVRRDNTDRKDSLNDAVRAIIWQLVQSDGGYAKSVQKECDQDKDFLTTSELWEHLITGLAKATNATFFLVLDGIDEVSEDSMNWLGEHLGNALLNDESTGSLRLRVLLCGRPRAINAVQHQCRHRVETIDLASRPHDELDDSDPSNVPHSDDIQKYIIQRDEWREILAAAQLAPDQEDFKVEFPSRLAASVQGNYGTLRDKLRRMEGCKDMDEIQDILRIDDVDSFEETAQRIERFTATLNPSEVDELNEILAWVSVGCDRPSVEILKEVLGWRFQKHFLLERTIANRYLELLTIDGLDEQRFVRFTSDSVASYLFDVEKEREQLQRWVAQKTEMRLVQQIIKTHLKNVFGDDGVYNRSELDDFFRSKQTDIARRIQLDDSESHTRILEICLAALCDREQSSRLNAIRKYANTWFDRHLGSGDPLMVSPSTRKDISVRLIRLFREPLLIERWWTKENLWLLRFWVVDDVLCEQVLRWFSDPDVDKHLRETLSPEENEWVRGTKGNPRRSLFEKVASVLLSQWRKARGKYEKPDTMQFLRAYVRLMLGQEVTFINYLEDFSVQDIEDFEQWATSDWNNANWQLCMAGSLLSAGFAAEACERCQRATELDQNNWQVLFIYAQALAADEKYNTALEKFELVTAIDEQLLRKEDEDYQVAYWSDILLQLGRCQAHLARFEEASKTFESILDHALREDTLSDSARHASIYLTASLSAQDSSDDILNLLVRLSERRFEDERTWLMDVFTDIDGIMIGTAFSKLGIGFHTTIMYAAKATNRFEEVEAYYSAAQNYLVKLQQSAKGDEDSEQRAQRLLVKHFHYKLIWFAGPQNRRVEALDGWEKDLIGTEVDSAFYFHDVCMFLLRDAAEHVAKAMLSEAKKPVSCRIFEPSPEIRLKKLTKIDHMISRYDTSYDLRLVLARLYVDKRQEHTARHTLLGLMRFSMNTILRGDVPIEDIVDSFRAIGHLLTVVEDDANARIAFIFAAERSAALSRAAKRDSERQQRVAPDNAVLEPTAASSAQQQSAGAELDQQFFESTAATNEPENQFNHSQGNTTIASLTETPRGSGTSAVLFSPTEEEQINGVAEDGRQYQENTTHSGSLGVVIPERNIDAAFDKGSLTASTGSAAGISRHHRVHQDYLSTVTLRHYKIDYEIDKSDDNYIIINQPLTNLEKELMFEHTTQLRRSSLDDEKNGVGADSLSLRTWINQLQDEEVFANLQFSCEYRHESSSSGKEVWWVCRDCLGIVLDQACVDGEREVICSSDHTHLRLAFSDIQDCRAGRSDRLLESERWLEQIKQDWKLDKPALRTFDDVLTLTLGVMAAKRFWKERKERKSGTKMIDYRVSRPVPMADLLRRADILGFRGPGDPMYSASQNEVEGLQTSTEQKLVKT